jgi:hypothetical protein
MFGTSKPVVLESYGSRRKRGRVPRWLVLLVSGIALGAVGVVVVQEKYLPPRLSASDSTTLRNSYETADADRIRLQKELAQTTKQRDTALGEKKALTDELSASRSTAQGLRDDLAAIVESLPADPRGGSIEVRAARFTVKGGNLVYDVVLTRDRGSKPVPGSVQLTVTGQAGGGPEKAVPLKPVPVSIGTHEVVRGSQPLPDGFRPRETTVQVLDRNGGKLGMRVMLVK